MRRGNRWASEATLVEYPENKVQNEKNKKQEKKKEGGHVSQSGPQLNLCGGFGSDYCHYPASKFR